MPQFINWRKWNSEVVEETHGKVEFYRDLYDGKHHKIFPRAKQLIESGEVVEVLENGQRVALKAQPPYIMANVAKLVVDIPAMLVSRAIGKPTVSSEQTFTDPELALEVGAENATTKLSEIIEQIYDESGLQFEHWTNIVQHQIDGGIVGVVISDDNGVRIQTKARDMYFPHPDGNGCDLVYHKTLFVGTEGDKDIYEQFVHIHREWVEKGSVKTEELLYRKKDGQDELDQVEDEAEIARLLEIETGQIKQTFPNRTKTFVQYLANDKTFREELGQSALKNQESKQDEINWTLTRNAIVFQRNGKPRIAVSKEIFNQLQEKAFQRYGDESKIDSDDLEITTYDEKGKALEVIQVDITKIGDVEWVKDLMKLMFIETRTSEKAVDFYLDGSGGAQSGIAKFYDLFVSIMKAEKIANEYTEFLEGLFESALYFVQKDIEELEIVKPNFTVREMIPVTRKEMIDTETAAYNEGNGIQSLESSVKRANPQYTDEDVEDELERIEDGKATMNSSNMAGGASLTTAQNLLDNRDANGNPLPDPNEETE